LQGDTIGQTHRRAALNRIILILTFCFFATGPLIGVWWWSYNEALNKLVAQGQSSLSLTADRLVSQLERYRQFPVILTSNPVLQDAVVRGGPLGDVNLFLEHMADITGALDILLLDQSGNAISVANWRDGSNAIGQNFSNRPDVIRAMNGALGYYHAQENANGPRGFYFASAVRGKGSTIAGVLAIHVDLEVLEVDWRADPETIFFTDEQGVIFITNRSSLLLRVLGDVPNEPDAVQQYATNALRPLDFIKSAHFGQERWMFEGAGEVPRNALYLQIPLPVIDMQGNILLDLSVVQQEAQLRTALAAAFLIMFGLLVAFLLQRRRTLAVRLQAEEKATSELETKVQKRTAQLLETNETLRHTQDDLVQAAKLSALGQMSAGISHELNQPLAAIQSYAENAVILLDRGRQDEAGKNLEKISGLSERMGRIIRNLRAFARKDGETVAKVDLVQVVEDTLELAGIRLRQKNVTTHWDKPAAPILVNGGGVRLQQVVLNLITNATDAMEGQGDKTIWLDIKVSDKVFLHVRDNGPGLQDVDKIFEPFYSTKTVGDGMGLGLSISYGIVQSFGGQIVGKNASDGGAVFSIELTPVEG